MLEKAYATGDAVLVRISGKETHPTWKRDGIMGDIVVELNDQEAIVAEEIETQRVGRTILAFRSFLAQLGIDAGHEETTSVQLRRKILHIRTLLTNVNGDRGESVLDVLDWMVRDGEKPVVGRGLLLPECARRDRDAVEAAQAREECSWDAKAIVREDGGVALPPLPLTFTFDDEAYKSSTLRKVLSGKGSGRAMLRANRHRELSLPPHIDSNEFFVGGFDISVPGPHHVVLRRGTVDEEGKGLPVQHSGAVFLAAGRTDKIYGDRQTELVNVNGTAVPTEKVHVIADFYHASMVEAGDL